MPTVDSSPAERRVGGYGDIRVCGSGERGSRLWGPGRMELREGVLEADAELSLGAGSGGD